MTSQPLPENPPAETDVLVVGAGPVGLAAALLADDLGYDVAMVSPPRAVTDERTAALLAGSVGLLTRLGVWPSLAAAAAPMRSLRIVDGTRRLIRAPEVTFHADEIELDAFGHNIPNSVLVAALEDELRQRGIPWIPAAVGSIRTGQSSAVATLSTGGAIAARLVVAADGRRSRIREEAGIPTDEWRYDQAALVVNLAHGHGHEDTSTEFHTEAGPFTLVPLPGRRSSLVWVDRPDEARRRLEIPEADLAVEIEERSASLLGAVRIDGRRQVFPLSGMNARRFAADRTVLVGEAAHLFPPIGAQGLNLGYRDVRALGRVLEGRRRDPGDASVTSAYDRARQGDIRLRTVAVDALNRSLLSGLLPVQGVRSAGLFALDRIPALRRAVMRLGAGADA